MKDKDITRTPSDSPEALEAAAIALTELDHVDDWSYCDWDMMDDWEKQAALDAAQVILNAARDTEPT